MDNAEVSAILEQVISNLQRKEIYSADDIAEKMASIDDSLTKGFLLDDNNGENTFTNCENTLLYREVCKLRNKGLILIEPITGEPHPGIIDFNIEIL